MAEEQFTSRRARREAERLAAEQAFEAREVPEQPTEAPNSRAGLLSPLPPKKPDTKPAAKPAPSTAEDTSSRIDPAPSPLTSHERGALASDHPQESRPPVHAEDRLDPTRTPLPHFQSRAEKKRYLREHGLSLYGDLSTGAMPVVAGEQELAERQAAAEGRLTGPIPEVSEPDAAGSKPSDGPGAVPDAPAHTDKPGAAEHESYDTAGFGGDSAEVAARDFEAPVTGASAPRPTTVDGEPFDAPSIPYSELDSDAPELGTETAKEEPADSTDKPGADGPAVVEPPASEGDAAPKADSASESESPDDGEEPSARSRRMPIVAPPSTSGVRVVTAASAQLPEVDQTGIDDASGTQAPGAAPAQGAASGPTTGAADSATAEAESDDAARALAANPETRPMDAVPEAWALPNADYEDEETANPPGSRIRAASVTGQDGQILMGEEPSKMPYIVLGVAAFFAVVLIVIALVMFL